MKSLYLGLDLPDEMNNPSVIHYPIIKIIPENFLNRDIRNAFQAILEYTHFIFTSKNAVRLFFECLRFYELRIDAVMQKHCVLVGQETAKTLKEFGSFTFSVAQPETAEGVIALLDEMLSSSSYVFWPHSKLSRTIITKYLESKKMRFNECILYDTKPHQPFLPPPLEAFQEIIFTSPSTVDAFLSLYEQFPDNTVLTTIGPVTRQHLENTIRKKSSVSLNSQGPLRWDDEANDIKDARNKSDGGSARPI